MKASENNSEWLTRKRLIDPKLRAAGWRIVPFSPGTPLTSYDRCAIEEFETANGPADYALCVHGQILGIVEAKKLTLGPQSVLTQAERYSKGATSSPLNFRGHRVPFLYSTNGEVIWHHDIRNALSRSRRIKNLLSQHQREGLPAADLKVIKRGKALEYFSRHYGKVYIEHGREFTIREALVGINQLLDDDTGITGGPEAPPSNAEPYTRQFFRLFYETTQVPRDQMQKFLRGTGIAPSDFEERGWCSEKNKVFIFTPPLELARAWKGASRKGMARDFDQTMFLVGGCVEGSNIRVMDTLDSPNFTPHPATAELVDWLTSHGGSQEIKFAAQRAQTIYRDWLSKNKAKAQDQMRLFDLEA